MTATTWSWSIPTTVFAGDNAITQAAAASAGIGRRALVVSDPRIATETLLVERWQGALAAAGVASSLALVEAPSLGEVARLAEVASAQRVQFLVGVGGGTVMDVAKATAFTLRSPGLEERRWDDPAGLVLPEVAQARRSLPTVLSPTTVGTGSEVSAAACLTGAGRKKLVLNALLRPTVAVLDPESTADSPRRVIVEGALEILLRCLGPALGTAADPTDASRPFVEALAVTVARNVVADGELVAHSGAGTTEGERAARHRLALASAHTHTGWLLVGQDPWAHKLWYLAHEVAAAAGVTKMAATAALLPAFLRTVSDGRWTDAGTPDRLAQLCAAVTARPWGSPEELAITLLRRWGLPSCLHDLGVGEDQVGEMAERTTAAWGPPSPALAGHDRAAIAHLYHSAFDPAPEPAFRPYRPSRTLERR